MPPPVFWRGYFDAVDAVQGCEGSFFCKYNKFDREMILR